MAETLATETRLVQLLGLVERQLHDEYHRQWHKAEGEEVASDQHISQDRLNELLEMMFPGKSVTVTDNAGKTLFSTEEAEKEEAEEHEEGGE